MDAWQRPRLRDIDATNDRVRVGTGQHASIQHTTRGHIVGKGGFATRQLRSVDGWQRLAYHAQLPIGWQSGARHSGNVLSRAIAASWANNGLLTSIAGTVLQRPLRLAAHHGGGVQYGLYGLFITSTGTEIAGERVAHLALGRIGIVLQESGGGKEHTRSAEATLDGTKVDKCLL